MNIETTKLELIHLLIQTKKTDWFTEMSKEEQEEIKIGLEQAHKGDFIENEKVMNRFEKWH